MSENTVGAERIAVALDAETTIENLRLVRELSGSARWYKVGMRQFYRSSEPILDAIREADAKLFLDLKLHDIPQTVRGAAQSLSRYSPELVTIHASGGTRMIEAALDGFASEGVDTKVVAVTVLTSLDAADLRGFGDDVDVIQVVSRLAGVARDAGAAGIVCSPLEVEALRETWSDAFFVTPGIRPAGAEAHDQKRVATPSSAIHNGSKLLVVGRPIREADEPLKAFENIANAPLG
jgi:orotidine-5'-phosphate decarboxylase